MGIGKLLGQPDPMLGGNLQRTSIPSRDSSNTPSCFMLQKPGEDPAVVRHQPRDDLSTFVFNL